MMVPRGLGGSLSLLAFAVAALIVLNVPAEHALAKPHIILMVLDDVGRADTGIYGDSNIPMPKLKGIAKEGVIFENFYTQPVCSPTRSSLLTGRYPFRFGMQHYLTQLPGMIAGVPLDVPMIPALLTNEGYERHAIGKWHCGYATWAHTPTKRGFQTYTGFLQAQGDYYSHKSVIPQAFGIPDRLDGFDFWQNARPYFEVRGNYSLDVYRDAMRRVVNRYIERQDTPEKQEEHPLFIYMAHQTVHIPLQFRQEEDRCKDIEHRVRRMYCNMMVELDDAVGEMVEELKSYGLWDNTLILTLTDNGGMVKYAQDKDGNPAQAASQGSNYPLRGSKATLLDGGIRSTAFAAGGATVLTLAGVLPAKKERLGIDGNNLFDLIANKPGAQPVRDHVPINIIEGGRKYSAVRFGKYKLIVDDSVNPDAQGWFDQNGDLKEPAPKYVKGLIQLFDLEKDPQERANIAQDNLHLVKYGRDLIRNYVEGGQYMEPQDSSRIHVRAFPIFHGGVWKPFMKANDWQENFNRGKAKGRTRLAPPWTDEDEIVSLKDEEFILVSSSAYSLAMS